jgi:sugar lactone lactonase YvrE
LGVTEPSIYADAIVEVDKASGRVKTFIDLWAYEAANNPDGNEIDSNVNDIAWASDGTMYIVETGANSLYSWTADDGLQVVQVWAENPVPDSIRFASNGDIYIGFLGAGLGPGAARIEHWSADASELIETFEGLTAVTDIALDADDNLYAVQFFQFGDQGPAPNSGSVVMVTADAITPIAENLSFPFGLAQAPDGSWAVTVNSAFLPPGSGAVVKIGGDM